MVIQNKHLNIHFIKKTDPKTIELINVLDSSDLTQHITNPTHQHGNTLDLVITTQLNINNVSIIELPLSDHLCILFDNCKIKTRKEVIFQKRHLDISEYLTKNVMFISKVLE